MKNNKVSKSSNVSKKINNKKSLKIDKDANEELGKELDIILKEIKKGEGDRYFTRDTGNVNIYKCHSCNNVFGLSSTFTNKISEDINFKYTCPYCGKMRGVRG